MELGPRPVEGLGVTALEAFYRGRRVLVTGHTGFKGGWLCTWLARLGAEVTGFALPPEDGPSYFREARVDADIDSRLGDLRDRDAVDAVVEAARPEVVFHLAARSLVRPSYRDPVDTWSTNILGTAHLLEALRWCSDVRAVVAVTSDKCYENREWAYAYRENDPLGGHDPYSASKGAQEILVASWRRSFFEARENPAVGIATARAGNVIGGGDWAEDRLIPDVVRALSAGQAVPVRSPDAVRPWQHVMEPLSAYLWLGLRLHQAPRAFAGPWNFGPDTGGTATVRRVVDRAVETWGEGRWDDVSAGEGAAPHEARLLRLDCTRAATLLGWRPALELDAAVDATMAWYRARADGDFDARTYTLGQLDAYRDAAARAGLGWAGR